MAGADDGGSGEMCYVNGIGMGMGMGMGTGTFAMENSLSNFLIEVLSGNHILSFLFGAEDEFSRNMNVVLGEYA